MSRARSLFVLPVVCLCTLAGAATVCAGASLAAGTPVARATSAARHPRTRTAVHCAKKSSFHARGGHIRRDRRPAGCAKRRSAERRSAKRGAAERRSAKRGAGGHRSDRRHAHHAKRRVQSTVKGADADSCPGAGEQPTSGNIETIRTATLCLVNQERTSRGETPLQPNAHLQQSAQSHTESMAFGDYFEHDGPGGDTPLSRMISAGYIPSGNVGYEIGENIGWGTFSLGTPRAIVAAWMASPGHRANILDAHFRDTAIGISPHVPPLLSGGQPGGIYTQDFGVVVTG